MQTSNIFVKNGRKTQPRLLRPGFSAKSRYHPECFTRITINRTMRTEGNISLSSSLNKIQSGTPMICRSCSLELPDQALFCPRCGFQFLKSKIRKTTEDTSDFEVHRARESLTDSFSERRVTARSGDDLAFFNSRFDAWLNILSAAATRNIESTELLKSLQGPRGIQGLRLLKSFYRRDCISRDFRNVPFAVPESGTGVAAALKGFQDLVTAGIADPQAIKLVKDLGFLEGLSEAAPEKIRNAAARLSEIQEQLGALLFSEAPAPEAPSEKSASPFGFSGSKVTRERLRFSSDTENSEAEELKSRERAQNLRNFRGLDGLYSDIRNTSGIKPPPQKTPDSGEPDLSGPVTDPQSYQGLRGVYRSLGATAQDPPRKIAPGPARRVTFPQSSLENSYASDTTDSAESSARQARIFRKELTRLIRSFHGLSLAVTIDLLFRFFPGLGIVSLAFHAGILIRTRKLSRSCRLFFENNHGAELAVKCQETEDDLPILWGMYCLNVFFGILTLWLALNPEYLAVFFDDGNPSDILLAQTAGLIVVWILSNIPDYKAFRNFLAVRKGLYGMADKKTLF